MTRIRVLAIVSLLTFGAQGLFAGPAVAAPPDCPTGVISDKPNSAIHFDLLIAWDDPNDSDADPDRVTFCRTKVGVTAVLDVDGDGLLDAPELEVLVTAAPPPALATVQVVNTDDDNVRLPVRVELVKELTGREPGASGAAGYDAIDTSAPEEFTATLTVDGPPAGAQVPVHINADFVVTPSTRPGQTGLAIIGERFTATADPLVRNNRRAGSLEYHALAANLDANVDVTLPAPGAAVVRIAGNQAQNATLSYLSQTSAETESLSATLEPLPAAGDAAPVTLDVSRGANPLIIWASPERVAHAQVVRTVTPTGAAAPTSAIDLRVEGLGRYVRYDQVNRTHLSLTSRVGAHANAARDPITAATVGLATGAQPIFLTDIQPDLAEEDSYVFRRVTSTADWTAVRAFAISDVAVDVDDVSRDGDPVTVDVPVIGYGTSGSTTHPFRFRGEQDDRIVTAAVHNLPAGFGFLFSPEQQRLGYTGTATIATVDVVIDDPTPTGPASRIEVHAETIPGGTHLIFQLYDEGACSLLGPCSGSHLQGVFLDTGGTTIGRVEVEMTGGGGTAPALDGARDGVVVRDDRRDSGAYSAFARIRGLRQLWVTQDRGYGATRDDLFEVHVVSNAGKPLTVDVVSHSRERRIDEYFVATLPRLPSTVDLRTSMVTEGLEPVRHSLTYGASERVGPLVVDTNTGDREHLHLDIPLLPVSLSFCKAVDNRCSGSGRDGMSLAISASERFVLNMFDCVQPQDGVCSGIGSAYTEIDGLSIRRGTIEIAAPDRHQDGHIYLDTQADGTTSDRQLSGRFDVRTVRTDTVCGGERRNRVEGELPSGFWANDRLVTLRADIAAYGTGPCSYLVTGVSYRFRYGAINCPSGTSFQVKSVAQLRSELCGSGWTDS